MLQDVDKKLLDEDIKSSVTTSHVPLFFPNTILPKRHMNKHDWTLNK